jgi:lysophospholipase L1-like esterase
VAPPGSARETLLRMGLLLATTVMAVTLAEIGARRWLPEVSDTIIVRLQEASERYHHAARFTVPPADPHATRIAFLGDSFTYGMGPRESAYPHLVEEAFREGSVAGVPARAVQAFNLGTPSYSPSIYGVVLRDWAPVIRPDLVVIAVDDSDPQDDYWYRTMLERDADGLPISVYPALVGVPHWLVPVARHVKLLRLTLGLIHTRGLTIRADPFDQFASPTERLAHYDPARAAAWAPRFDYSIDLIDAMVRYCRRHDIPVAIVNYPYPPAVTTRHCLAWRKGFGLDASRLYEPAFHAAQAEYARAHDVPYYDFTPTLRQRSDLDGVLDGVYKEDDGHFTALGNALFAQELVRFLAPLLPPGPG